MTFTATSMDGYATQEIFPDSTYDSTFSSRFLWYSIFIYVAAATYYTWIWQPRYKLTGGRHGTRGNGSNLATKKFCVRWWYITMYVNQFTEFKTNFKAVLMFCEVKIIQTYWILYNLSMDNYVAIVICMGINECRENVWGSDFVYQ
jgi:hypothetical protein